MKSYLTELLDYSIKQIDNLHSYYLSQHDYTMGYVEKNLKKYKYGLILDKFFLNQLEIDKEFHFSQEEEDIIAEMLEEFEVCDDEDASCRRISYKLKDSFSVDEEYEIDPNKAKVGATSLLQQPDILSESVLIMLMVKYEDSISRLFRYLIDKFPQAFLSDKSITYSELMGMESNIDEIKEKFISKEIDQIMSQPISCWYESFKRKQKAKFLFADDLFVNFKEVYYRRNLVVHNQGIINDIYLSNIKNTSAKQGEKLRVDKDYLEKAFSLTRLILLDTFFGFIKIEEDKEQKDELISWIMDYGYFCLAEKKWEQAKYIHRIILQYDSLQTIDRLISQVNYWICIKNMEGISNIQTEVNSFDVSAMQLQFAVAKSALLDKHKEVAALLDQCLETGEIPAYYIKTWPLLNEFRASSEYIEFVDRHRDELDIVEYEATDNSEEMILPTDEVENEEGTLARPQNEVFPKMCEEA